MINFICFRDNTKRLAIIEELKTPTLKINFRKSESIEVDDNMTAITASRECTHLLVNISMTKPRIELISLDES